MDDTNSSHDSARDGVEKKPDSCNENQEMPVTSERRSFVILPWRIALFLFTSTVLQNFAYGQSGVSNLGLYGAYPAEPLWTKQQQSSYQCLVYYVLYLGPLFGLAIDLIRVFRERYRPTIIAALVVNFALSLIIGLSPSIYRDSDFVGCLLTIWLMNIAIMFVYIPMNAVVIWHGNCATESAHESSSRIGGLMAQAMVCRTAGSFLQSTISTYSGSEKLTTRVNSYVSAALSALLIFQMLFLMDRSYFVDQREASLKTSTTWRFIKSIMDVSKSAVAGTRQVKGSTFMFIVSIVFIYFMIPDALYTTIYNFNYNYTAKMPPRVSQTTSMLMSLGTVCGALLYAVWMYYEYQRESSQGRRLTPVVIMFAGCAFWSFGTLFHLFGAIASSSSTTNWKAFICIQNFVVGLCLRFSFMPTLSLAAMHAPRNYETTAFEVYSIAASGGGVVSSAISTPVMTSLNSSVSEAYWKFLLLCVFFQFLPMVFAFSIPKCRDAHDEEEEGNDKILLNASGNSEPFRGLA